MDIGHCPTCKIKFQVNLAQKSKPLNCPHCKSALFVESVPDRREAPPPPPAGALDLDDAEELPPPVPTEQYAAPLEDEPRPARKSRRGMLLLLLALGALLHGAGGFILWLSMKDQPPETAEATAPERPKEKNTEKPREKDHDKPKEQPKPKEEVRPKAKPKVDVAALRARAKDGAPAARVEAIDQLADRGGEARAAVPDLIVMLDDAEPGVRKASEDALEKIGPPAEDDADCIPKALAGTGRFAKLYALKHYSKNEIVAADQLPLVVKCLDDSEASVRGQALAALEKFGPGGKRDAFLPLLARATDADAAIAGRAAALLASFAPFDEAQRKLLVANLENAAWQRRRLAVTLLASSADEKTASAWFEPLLTDQSREVRVAALAALGKWPALVKRLENVLIPLLAEDHAALRAAVIRALGQCGSGPRVKTALVGVTGPTAAAETRKLATQTLLKMDYTDPKTDIPILAALLALDDSATKIAAFGMAAGLKAYAKELLPQIGDGLKHTNNDVRIAALKLAGAVGPDAAALVPGLTDMLMRPGKDAVAVQVQTVDALAKLGPAGRTVLFDAVDGDHSDDILKQIFQSLARTGAAVPEKVQPKLFALAEKSETLRPALGELIGRAGGDDLARLCAERTYWAFNAKKQKVCKYELPVQVWAIETMGRMDPKSMTEKGRTILIERMKSLPKTNPDRECRTAAEEAQKKLAAAGLGEKP